MSERLHSFARGTKAAGWLHGAVALAILAATVLQGLSFCPCSSTAHGSCHEQSAPLAANASSINHVCEHFSLDALQPGAELSSPLQELLNHLLLAMVGASPAVNIGAQIHEDNHRGWSAPATVVLLKITRTVQMRC